MILKKQFNGFEVDFEPFVKGKNVMVNATQMAKTFDESVEHFTRLDATKKFIQECLKNPNMGFLQIEKEEDLITSVQKSGTWMHRVLALKFAAWLNPAFELWIYRTIDEILFGKLAETELSIEKTVALQTEMEELVKKQVKTGEDFQRYLDLKKEHARERSRRKALTTERFEQVYDLFNQPENVIGN